MDPKSCDNNEIHLYIYLVTFEILQTSPACPTVLPFSKRALVYAQCPKTCNERFCR